MKRDNTLEVSYKERAAFYVSEHPPDEVPGPESGSHASTLHHTTQAEVAQARLPPLQCLPLDGRGHGHPHRFVQMRTGAIHHIPALDVRTDIGVAVFLEACGQVGHGDPVAAPDVDPAQKRRVARAHRDRGSM